MGMKDMIKECMHSMMGTKKGGISQEVVEDTPMDTLMDMINSSPVDNAIVDALQRHTGQRTVPNIFIGGSHIGGNAELQALACRRQRVLQDAGAVETR
ncbi:hypothetical protein DL764_004200 [Monosporascus ibericus]|uniref:Glutaredoxin domain-containing protein n=1 Tax=Monosporascus ibericus TaxID=155417 RepID=A0A4Q4TH87_9PEZI|nr:hypothetical protein DL764_004200 [Monosporascus ibericus]